jgi:hypothetical protein
VSAGALIAVELRTTDEAWIARHGRPGRDGRTVALVREVDRRTVAHTGAKLITYAFPGEIPADLARTGFAPVGWIVGGETP